MDYKALGQEAYEEYFRRIDGDDNQSGVLEDIISNIAQREELNPEQIARICQFVNTKVFLKLFKTLKDKTFEFAVADPKNIINITTPQETTVVIDEPIEEVEEEPVEEIPELDFKELMAVKKQIEDRLNDAVVHSMEERPLLIKRLASRIHQYDPQTVMIAVRSVGGPEELLKAACQKAGFDYDKVEITLNPDDYIVDDSDALLQKVSSYGKMMAEKQVCQESLEKVAEVEKLALTVQTGMNIMQGVGELKDSAGKASQAKRDILGNQPMANRFTVKNKPRRMPTGSVGYVRSS